MKSRLLMSAIGVPLILLVILWAPIWVLALFLAALSGVAAWELMNCVSAKRHGVLCTAAILGALFSAAYAYFKVYIGGELVVVYVIAVFAYAVFRGGEVKFQQIMAALFAMFVVPYAFTSFLRLDALGFHRSTLLLPLLFSFASDTGAFFAGRALGKHKLAPRVSPHKTVEGAVGGLAGNVACGLLFVFVMDRLFGGCAIGYGPMVLLALFCGAAAQIGALSFSLIKREFGIKDYGHIFLAHGGVLDRFDSVLFVAPAVEIIFQLLA